MKKKSNKRVIDKNLYLVINLAISCLCFCLIFIEGENVWLFSRNLYLGVFGINSIFLPFFLIIISFLKIKNGNIDKFRSVLSCLFSLFFSSLVGIFTYPHSDFFKFFYVSGICNAGIISGLIDIC